MLAAGDLLVDIGALAGGWEVGGGRDALGVDDAGRRLGTEALGGANQAPWQAVELGEYAVILPAGEVGVDGFRGRVVVWEVAPGDAGAVHLQDGVQQVTQLVLGRSAEREGPFGAGSAPGGQSGLDQGRASDRSRSDTVDEPSQ